MSKRLYDVQAILPSGEVLQFIGWSSNIISFQNRVAKKYPQQFPKDWKSVVRWVGQKRS